MLCGNFIVNGIAFMLYFFFLKLKMLGVDHPFPDSSTPTFIIEPIKILRIDRRIFCILADSEIESMRKEL